ncbi:glycoside hydrolase family 76 protein [Actinoplanes sp. KI2]|uniref:glycoside hydrolase family 76 protein n=1 Tax=Actinoplanes sp. KI2 TaxID=2983315 RepID=UPI0021D5D293|nr:glycoside hydrolase family 76 protein [Actinoplanes sp. KI2]MCU7727563.1 glycoside hydrolase family 76 protein [Actinoplanes sp. KI2]
MKRVVVAVVTFLAVVLSGSPAQARPTRPGAVASAAPLAAAVVCSVSCDQLDPSRAKQDTFPVADRIQNGRRISLHLSDADAMAWGSIDNGGTGDSVWLDRTFDGGATWDGLLGKASIPSTWTGTRTLMYNLADPSHHRRGMIRACGDAAGVQCTDWVHAQACDVVCDGVTTAVGDTQPVPATTLSGRTIALHIDTRGMAWATIGGGAPGDEVWLDRSWDEGASWPGGSSLGRLSTPSGATGTRTALFASRDTKALLYGGALRACGRAVTGNNGSCTAWARPADNRAAAAADALMWAYQPDTAWWPSSWWNSADTITTLMAWMKRSGRTDYRWVVDRTFTVNRVAFPAGVKSGDPIEGDFISRAVDDAGWWGLAWLQAYDLTGDGKYLTEAVTIANYVSGFWDTSTCGGGVWWDRERTYKNAVTIGLYIRLSAALHNRIAGDTAWLNRATTGWNWFVASGMINSSNLVNDGLTTSCANNNGTVYTYNQGLAIGAAVELYRATGASAVLAKARALADAATANGVLTKNGILTESCDAADRTCDDNGKQFKGIFMRGLLELADVTGQASYRTYAQTQADRIWTADRDSLNRLGERWTGTTSAAYPNARDWRTQTSALGALIAAASG